MNSLSDQFKTLPEPKQSSRPHLRFRNHAGFSGLRVFGILAILVVAAEVLLCFSGPIAFVRKPSLAFFPLFSTNLSAEESAATTAFIEQELALTGSYTIVSQSFIEEYFMRTDPDFDRSKLKPASYQEAQSLAQDLGLERIAIATIMKYYDRIELSVYIREVAYGETIDSYTVASDSLENLLKGLGKDGEELRIRENLKTETKGITFTNYLVLALIALQLLLGVLALIGREPGLLTEIVWSSALILFIFAYIHARSANMDYMQRFIATQGYFRLAQNTTLEQLRALLRFGPILILNGGYYIYRTIFANRMKAGGHWLHRWIKPWALPWVLVSALLYALSFPSFVSLDGIGFLAWFCLVPLLLVLLSSSAGMGIVYGVVFGVLQALIINYWHGTYGFVTLHLITITFVVEYLVFMLLMVGLIKISKKWGFLAVPVAWVLFDYVRSISVLGYPWGLIGTTQYQFIPLIQIASVTGVWGIGFIVLLCNSSVAWAVAGPAFGWTWIRRAPVADTIFKRQTSGSWRKMRSYILSLLRAAPAPLFKGTFPVVIFILFLAFSLVTGSIILHKMQARLYGNPEINKATIVVIQSNRDPRKHEYRDNIKRLMSLTDQAIAAAPTKPDLVVWPEGGFKLDIRYWSQEEKAQSYWGRFVREFLDYQKDLGTWILTGTQDHEMRISETGESKRKNFNSSVLLDPQGKIVDFYHKMHLVPFSEYFPLDKVRFASIYQLFEKFNISDWGIGRERVVFQHDKMRIFTPICFEDVFSDHVRRYVLRDADVILNMSNDYWSLSPVEGRQHGLLALFRAVENQRPLLRSTTSGYTVYIDATGRIQPGSPEPYTAGYIIAQVPLPERRLTFYTRWGDWFPLLCGFGVLAMLATGSVMRLLNRRRAPHLESPAYDGPKGERGSADFPDVDRSPDLGYSLGTRV